MDQKAFFIYFTDGRKEKRNIFLNNGRVSEPQKRENEKGLLRKFQREKAKTEKENTRKPCPKYYTYFVKNLTR